MGSYWSNSSPPANDGLRQGNELGRLRPSTSVDETILQKLGLPSEHMESTLEKLCESRIRTWHGLMLLVGAGEEAMKHVINDDATGSMFWNLLMPHQSTYDAFVDKVEDRSQSIQHELLQPLERLPTLEELQLMFSQPLETQIPVSPALAKAFHEKSTKVTGPFSGTIGCLRASINQCTTLEENLLLLSRYVHSKSENMEDTYDDQEEHQLYQTVFEKLLPNVLKLCCVNSFKFERRTAIADGTLICPIPGTKRPSDAMQSDFNELSTSKRCKTRDPEILVQLPDTSTKANEAARSGSSLLLQVADVPILLGVEQQSNLEVTLAEKNLLTKAVWNPIVMGKIPYIFGYVTCGSQIRLYAIHPMPLTGQLTLMSLGRGLVVTRAEDCLELVQWVFRIARVLARASVEISLHGEVPPIGSVWRRVSHGPCEITIHETYLDKCIWENDGGRVKWDGDGGLNELYDLIDKGLIVGTVRCKDMFRKIDLRENREVARVLRLEPLGYRVTPMEYEICDFLVDVLQALHSMHSNGWVHRDVKLGNLVKRVDGRWILIDLEYAAKLSEDGTAEWPFFDREGYPMPERENDQEKWKPEHDVKQVGIMLEELASFRQHPQRSKIIDYLLLEATTADVIDDIRPLLIDDGNHE